MIMRSAGQGSPCIIYKCHWRKPAYLEPKRNGKQQIKPSPNRIQDEKLLPLSKEYRLIGLCCFKLFRKGHFAADVIAGANCKKRNRYSAYDMNNGTINYIVYI